LKISASNQSPYSILNSKISAAEIDPTDRRLTNILEAPVAVMHYHLIFIHTDIYRFSSFHFWIFIPIPFQASGAGTNNHQLQQLSAAEIRAAPQQKFAKM
jgi:hypothetical protein